MQKNNLCKESFEDLFEVQLLLGLKRKKSVFNL